MFFNGNSEVCNNAYDEYCRSFKFNEQLKRECSLTFCWSNSTSLLPLCILQKLDSTSNLDYFRNFFMRNLTRAIWRRNMGIGESWTQKCSDIRGYESVFVFFLWYYVYEFSFTDYTVSQQDFFGNFFLVLCALRIIFRVKFCSDWFQFIASFMDSMFYNAFLADFFSIFRWDPQSLPGERSMKLRVID